MPKTVCANPDKTDLCDTAHKGAKIDLLLRLGDAVHLESAAIAPQTSLLIELGKEAIEEIDRLRADIGGYVIECSQLRARLDALPTDQDAEIQWLTDALAICRKENAELLADVKIAFGNTNAAIEDYNETLAEVERQREAIANMVEKNTQLSASLEITGEAYQDLVNEHDALRAEVERLQGIVRTYECARNARVAALEEVLETVALSIDARSALEDAARVAEDYVYEPEKPSVADAIRALIPSSRKP